MGCNGLNEKLRRLFDSKRRQPQKSQKPGCPILSLPVELLVPISEHLPLASQVFLSQTCHSLRHVFAHFRALVHLPNEDRLEYLVDRVRNIPGRWLCEVCLQLHHIHPYDTPENPRNLTCPLGWQRLRKGGYGLMSICLDYRHVQLTLKYARISATNQAYQGYLKALLKPVETSFTTELGIPNWLHTKHSVFPKVVAGRYLLQSVYFYLENRTVVTRETIGELRVCLHQRCAPGQAGMSNFFRSGPSILAIPLPQPYGTTLGETAEAAFNDMGHEKCGHCPLCLTDFSVYVTPQRAVVSVWQDLGAEGSPLDPAWVTHTRKFRRDHDVYISHRPGAVRRLHDQGHGMIEFGSV